MPLLPIACQCATFWYAGTDVPHRDTRQAAVPAGVVASGQRLAPPAKRVPQQPAAVVPLTQPEATHKRRAGQHRGGMANKAHHSDPQYRRRAALIRAAAYRDPTTICWRCGLTLDEARRKRPRETWDAGHKRDGDLSAGLAAEHAYCNRAAGAAAGNAKREPRSRSWD